jgi:hypothetical protein
MMQWGVKSLYCIMQQGGKSRRCILHYAAGSQILLPKTPYCAPILSLILKTSSSECFISVRVRDRLPGGQDLPAAAASRRRVAGPGQPAGGGTAHLQAGTPGWTPHLPKVRILRRIAENKVSPTVVILLLRIP